MMSNIIKKIAVILAVTMLTGCEESLIEMGFSKTPVKISTTESDTDDEVYKGILESLENGTLVSNHNGKQDGDKVSEIINRIRADYPEYFWIDGCTITTSKGKSEIAINIVDGCKPSEIESMFGELTAKADEIINQIPPALDDYNKVLFVHDYIVNNTTYDTAGAESDENGLYGTAYGCLVQGKAICQGYSQAFQYLMKKIGIECGICTGDSYQGRHAWNYVNLNEKYYWIDVTWDDPVGEVETLSHTYCLIDDEHLFRTRYNDDDLDFVPHCYSMDDNYYVRRGAYLAYYSDEEISKILNANAMTGYAEIMFADESSYKEAIKRLFDDGVIWNLIGGTEVTYTNDDTMYIIKISY